MSRCRHSTVSKKRTLLSICLRVALFSFQAMEANLVARSSEWTEAKLKRFLAEGRGQGERENYRPWLTVMDIPSRGRASRVFST